MSSLIFAVILICMASVNGQGANCQLPNDYQVEYEFTSRPSSPSCINECEQTLTTMYTELGFAPLLPVTSISTVRYYRNGNTFAKEFSNQRWVFGINTAEEEYCFIINTDTGSCNTDLTYNDCQDGFMESPQSGLEDYYVQAQPSARMFNSVMYPVTKYHNHAATQQHWVYADVDSGCVLISYFKPFECYYKIRTVMSVSTTVTDTDKLEIPNNCFN